MCRSNDNKKIGITLIELVIYLSICSILLITFIGGYKAMEHTRKEKIIDSKTMDLFNLISETKLRCKNNNKSSMIVYNERLKSIVVYLNQDGVFNMIDKLNMEDVGSVYINSRENRLEINKEGFITTPCTIKLKDISTNTIRKITVSVGSEYIRVKKGSGNVAFEDDYKSESIEIK